MLLRKTKRANWSEEVALSSAGEKSVLEQAAKSLCKDGYLLAGLDILLAVTILL